MPCRSDHMEPNSRERESKLVAHLLSYLHNKGGYEVPKWILDAAQDVYGNPTELDHMTALLCATCREMPEESQARLIWDGRNAQARQLADWWDRHKKADEMREAGERLRLQQQAKLKQITQKLSKKELSMLVAAVRKGEIGHLL